MSTEPNDASTPLPKLLPCPFCGKQVGFCYDENAYLAPNHLTVTCSCGAVIGGFPSRQEATAAWNKRVQGPQSAPTHSNSGNALSPESGASVASTQGEAKKGLVDK